MQTGRYHSFTETDEPSRRYTVDCRKAFLMSGRVVGAFPETTVMAVPRANADDVVAWIARHANASHLARGLAMSLRLLQGNTRLPS